MNYLVAWYIDIEADSPKEAAEEALRIQRDPSSIATVFDVMVKGNEVNTHNTIDLTPEEST